jgi:hypothetical protein
MAMIEAVAPDKAAMLATPPEQVVTSPRLTQPKTPRPAAKPHARMAALPPQTAFGHPSVTIIRGARRPVATHRAPAAKKQRMAALPSGGAATRTATDAPPILVLRGTHRPRYALASAPRFAPEPLVTVIRGARPRPVLLRQYIQPNALILHIHH